MYYVISKYSEETSFQVKGWSVTKQQETKMEKTEAREKMNTVTILDKTFCYGLWCTDI